jgi:Methyltransferase domain
MGPVNAQYNVSAPDSLAIRVASWQRRKMLDAFLALGVSGDDTILDIGVTSDRSYDHSNYLEAWYPRKDKITAAGIDAGASFLERAYPGVRFVRADGRALPFADRSFDYVHASAVLEHVGSRGQQAAFIAEVLRVARKGAFLTTPNRWFPIEFHTVLPLVHWLPAPMFRHILRAVGRGFFADEANLNLLSAGGLRRLARSQGLDRGVSVRGVRLFGVTSNLLFIAMR